MVDAEKRSLYHSGLVLVTFMSLLLVVDFLMRFLNLRSSLSGLDLFDQTLVTTVNNIQTKITWLRGSLVLGIIGLSLLKTKEFGAKNSWSRIGYLMLAIILIIIFLRGYSNSRYYNLIIYPVVFIELFFVIPKGVQSIFSFGKSSDSSLEKVSGKDEEFSFSFHTDKGQLNLLDARTATFIEGSAKAGKTASLIIPIIVQSIENGFAGLIYDYEGDLREEGSGLLSRTAYSAVKKSQGKVNFAIINFTDLSRTVRCNPLSSQYVSSYNHAVELATVIMYNINRNWSKHKDFWAENAIAAYAATIWYFRRNHPRYCTIPHITEFLLKDFRKVLRVLQTDEDVAPYIRPILAALDRDASGQIAGAESSTQFLLSRMRSPEVYYVFNPDPDQEFDLDITNKENPVILSICNSPELQNALAPAIGAIIQVCKVQMNKLGKQKSIFLFDEMPTIYVDKADKIPAEARKKQVCTFFAVQAYEQLVRDYGIQNAGVIRNACGNLFTGVSSVDSAEMISKMMGDNKQEDYSLTSSDSGQSITQSLKTERVLKASEVAGQDTGHFSGRILGGKPPFFSAQFRYKEYPSDEIPHFNFPVLMDDFDSQQMILRLMVRENYQQVIQDINELVTNYESKLNLDEHED